MASLEFSGSTKTATCSMPCYRSSLARWPLLATADLMSTNGFVLKDASWAQKSITWRGLQEGVSQTMDAALSWRHKPSPSSHVWTPSESPQRHFSYKWDRQFCTWWISKALCTSDCKDQPDSSSEESDLWNPHRDREYLGNRKLKAIICTPNAFT